jgi:hypothetical protein
MNIYYPDRAQHNDSLFSELLLLKESQYSSKLQRANVSQSLTPGKLMSLLGMYLNFVLVYAIVMFLTYYGVQTIALFRFIRHRAKVDPPLNETKKPFKTALVKILGAFLKIIAYGILFSPAYVIAYSIRTDKLIIIFIIILKILENISNLYV